MAFPTTSVLDNFTGSDGALGANWTALSNFNKPYTLASNTAEVDHTSNAEGGSYWNAATYTDAEVYATIARLPDQTYSSVGLEARITTPGGNRNCYHLDWANDGSFALYKVTNNGFAALGTGTTRTLTVGFKFGLSVTGGATTTVKAYTDEGSGWVERISVDDSSSPHTAAGNIGIQFYNAGGEAGFARLDDFGGGEVGSGTSTPMTLTGATTPSGTVVKSHGRAIAGELTLAGILSTFKGRYATLTGGITPSGTLSKVATFLRLLSGSLTSTGAISRVMSFVRTLTGAVSLAGQLIQAGGNIFYKTLTGILHPTGPSGYTTQYQRTETGSSTPTGALLKILQLVRTLTGTITPSGTLTRILTLLQTFAGEVTSGGVLSYIKAKAMTFAGELTSSGTVTWALNLVRTLTGAVGQAGTLVKSQARALAGNITPSGVLDFFKGLSMTLSGAVSMAGTLARSMSFVKTLTGAVTFFGDIGKRTSRAFAGALTFLGNLYGSVPSPITHFVALTLRVRSRLITLLNRSRGLTLRDR